MNFFLPVNKNCFEFFVQWTTINHFKDSSHRFYHWNRKLNEKIFIVSIVVVLTFLVFSFKQKKAWQSLVEIINGTIYWIYIYIKLRRNDENLFNCPVLQNVLLCLLAFGLICPAWKFKLTYHRLSFPSRIFVVCLYNIKLHQIVKSHEFICFLITYAVDYNYNGPFITSSLSTFTNNSKIKILLG